MAAVRLDKVSKRFILYHERPRSFQELVVNAFRRGQREELWALKDVSFTVPEGETWGIIGPNGSGKSTLLKLIVGIIEPTAGKISVTGKVSALLELGAGFHPDLTGRENVYLSASILGLARKDVDRRMHSIVEFAGLERFMDVPVKRYSSGMFIRLGFSVAIHMDPEILLVDEALAVGDAAFQRKCWERLFHLQKEGKTIIVVSHDLGAIQRLGHKAILLERGRLAYVGNPQEAIRHYQGGERALLPTCRGSGEAEITGVRILDSQGKETAMFWLGGPLTVDVQYVAHEVIDNPVFGVQICREEDSYSPYGAICHDTNTERAGRSTGRVLGRCAFRLHYPSLSLLAGHYYVRVGLLRDGGGLNPYCLLDRVCPFEVSTDSEAGAGIAGMAHDWVL
jgi:ABC-type polysaccharide/polyol phosphate transport system ATPase subunit